MPTRNDDPREYNPNVGLRQPSPALLRLMRRLYDAECAASSLSDEEPVIAQDDIADLELPTVITMDSRPLRDRDWSMPTPAPTRKAKSLFYVQLVQLYQRHVYSPKQPQVTFPQLLRHHDAYPTLHTTASYNLLISLAIRHTVFRTAFALFIAMRRNGIHTNFETEKLFVRLLVRTGRWDEAWERVFGPDGAARFYVERNPFVFWLEFFEFASPAIERPRAWKAAFNQEIKPERAQVVFRKLLSQMPPLGASSFSWNGGVVTPRVIAAIIYRLLRSRASQGAYRLATVFLQALPPLHEERDRRLHDAAVRIINMFLVTWLDERQPFRHVRDGLDKLLALNTEVIPDTKVLYFLICALRGSRRPTERALALRAQFQAKYRTTFDHSSIRHAIATLAVDEGRQDMVLRMFRKERTIRYKARKAPAGVTLPNLPLRARLPLRTVFPNKGTERKKWGELRKRCRRKWGAFAYRLLL